ncbi:PASTA domain-containing protein [Actinocrispum sp. NPDC049592]|uniref:PASTA domain-containing protein n=1 Tax=Actinocrispum sp. NPDC049592 TaxID=3154835 RepID=UPI003447F00A
MRNAIKLMVACAMLVAAGCGQVTTPGGTLTTSAHTQQTQQPKPAKQWAMPNLVGSNLQQAQDQMQKLTGDPVFLTTSHDATGQKRHQVLDKNWKVCSQSVAPGTQITLDSPIDFGAVKNEESCP